MSRTIEKLSTLTRRSRDESWFIETTRFPLSTCSIGVARKSARPVCASWPKKQANATTPTKQPAVGRCKFPRMISPTRRYLTAAKALINGYYIGGMLAD